LLGLAAVAIHQGRMPEAYGYYRRLIELDPRDSVALAGIASLTGSGGREANESRLKLLLDQSPGAGHLHFTLGNLYAKQGRWTEAQAAYFKAYTSDSENPDYAFNLAVSLDQIGQERAALGYYRRAVDAAARGGQGLRHCTGPHADPGAVEPTFEALITGGLNHRRAVNEGTFPYLPYDRKLA
jgi:tetratricopeptide (TPR) repeat protein